MATTSNKTSNNTWQKATPVSCMDCRYSCLIQYGDNPILAECMKKPQPDNRLFPYQREVARSMRICAMHRHTDEVKRIQKRTAA